ncbi:MAG: hypothetical protein AAF065_11635 [Verrucomicrobiota bacterium]
MLHFFFFVTLFLAVGLFAGCASVESSMLHTQTVPDSKYQAALEWTDPVNFDIPAPGSEAEAAMLEGVKTLFRDYRNEILETKVTEVYAEKVYFRDAFKQYGSSHEIKAYFLEGLDVLNEAEFEFRRVARAGDEFYLDWVMRLDFKKTPPGTWEESIGMTHMRFNSEGQVIFHQDYWDPTDIVYQRIPIAKQLINYVKGKI